MLHRDKKKTLTLSNLKRKLILQLYQHGKKIFFDDKKIFRHQKPFSKTMASTGIKNPETKKKLARKFIEQQATKDLSKG